MRRLQSIGRGVALSNDSTATARLRNGARMPIVCVLLLLPPQPSPAVSHLPPPLLQPCRNPQRRRI